MNKEKINTKTIARIAAIQVLYQYKLDSSQNINLIVKKIIDLYQDLEFRDDLEILTENKIKIKPSVSYLQDLVTLTIDNLSLIDEIIKINAKTNRNKLQLPSRFSGEIIQKKLSTNITTNNFDSLKTVDNNEDKIIKIFDIEDLSTLLLVLLRVAICEIKYFPKTPRKVIVNEYTDISSDMLTEYEVGFVNSMLDNISKQGEC